MSVAFDYAPAVSVPDRALPCRPVESPDRLASVTVLRAPRGSAGAAPLRLTRRGVVVLTLAVAAVAGALVWLAALSAPSPVAPPAAGPHAVTVEAGDTLWSIAAQVAPQRDPRAEVAVLQQANHLSSVDLNPGQVLRVP